MNVPDELPRPQRLQLPDGRRLAWYEFGDPEGTPCVYTTGTPTSGIAGAFYHESASARAVRWISLDKPGYGQSDYQPGRRLLDWPGDVAALADHLRLRRFAVAGESGGGPHALVLCHALPHRVSTGLLLAGVGPMQDRAACRGMYRANRAMFWLARHAPALLWPPLAMARRSALRAQPDAPRDAHKLRTRLAGMPPADRALYERAEVRQLLTRAGAEALRPGVRAAIDEAVLLASPWGFDLAGIRVPVHLWHGTEDVNVPVGMARAMAAALPRSTLHIVGGAGHLVSLGSHAQIMDAVIQAAADADANEAAPAAR